MKGTQSLLQQPVEIACREVAMSLLDAAVQGSVRLGDAGDSEALHDFRVAIRRLRSILRQYRDYVDKPLAKKLRKRLGELTEATNAGRDNEVHIHILRELLTRRLGRLAGAGVRMLLDQFESPPLPLPPPEGASETAGFSGEGVTQQLQDNFAKLETKLRQRLSRNPKVKLDDKRRLRTFAAATGRIVQALCSELGEDLASVHGADDEQAIHASRLTAKKLRYVLEPVQKKVVGGRQAVRRLKQLQDLLGDLHDLQTLRARIDTAMQKEAAHWAHRLASAAAATERPSALRQAVPRNDACGALAAVIQTLRRKQNKLFQSVQRRWLHDQAQPFLATIDAMARELIEGPRRRVKSPAATPAPLSDVPITDATPPSTPPSDAPAPSQSTENS